MNTFYNTNFLVTSRPLPFPEGLQKGNYHLLCHPVSQNHLWLEFDGQFFTLTMSVRSNRNYRNFFPCSCFCWRRPFLGLCPPYFVTMRVCSFHQNSCKKQMSNCSGQFEERLIRCGQMQKSEGWESAWRLVWCSRMERHSHRKGWGGNWLLEPGKRLLCEEGCMAGVWSLVEARPQGTCRTGAGVQKPQPPSVPNVQSPVGATYWQKQIRGHPCSQHRLASQGSEKVRE